MHRSNRIFWLNDYFAVAILTTFLCSGCETKEFSFDVSSGKVSTADNQQVELQILDFDGIQKLVESKRGKVVVMDAWSTSCPPCVKEFPNLVALHKKYGDAHLACISLSFDYEGIGKPFEVAPKVLKFLTEQQATFDNVLSSDESEALYGKFHLASVPAVFVYDREGTLVKRFDNTKATTEADAFTYQQVGKLVDELLK